MRLFLIGFMGSGKTYLGRKLAARLSYDFVDLDEFIEKEEARTIAQIFEKDGETHFRQLERDYLKKLEQFQMVVIACGGGTPCFYDNMDWMKTHGITFFLNTPLTILIERLKKERTHRPLITAKSEEEWIAFTARLLNQRKPFYEQAHHSCMMKKSLEEMLEKLENYTKKEFDL